MRKRISCSDHCLINMHQDADMGRVIFLYSNQTRVQNIDGYMEPNTLPHESL